MAKRVTIRLPDDLYAALVAAAEAANRPLSRQIEGYLRAGITADGEQRRARGDRAE